MTRIIEVSMFPGQSREVDDIEYVDLKAQGLIVDELDEKETPEAEPIKQQTERNASRNEGGQ